MTPGIAISGKPITTSWRAAGVTPAVAKQTLCAPTPPPLARYWSASGEADGMICGTVGQYMKHYHHVVDIVGLRPGVETAAALSCVVIVQKGTFFITDTHVNPEPSAIAQISEITLLAADEIREFGIEPQSGVDLAFQFWDPPRRSRV
jgi:malate dehydrogenase (oxaloacetate-decarboxylating)(NADP+)